MYSGTQNDFNFLSKAELEESRFLFEQYEKYHKNRGISRNDPIDLSVGEEGLGNLEDDFMECDRDIIENQNLQYEQCVIADTIQQPIFEEKEEEKEEKEEEKEKKKNAKILEDFISCGEKRFQYGLSYRDKFGNEVKQSSVYLKEEMYLLLSEECHRENLEYLPHPLILKDFLISKGLNVHCGKNSYFQNMQTIIIYCSKE